MCSTMLLACLHPNTILMEADWTTVPCPATNLIICVTQDATPIGWHRYALDPVDIINA